MLLCESIERFSFPPFSLSPNEDEECVTFDVLVAFPGNSDKDEEDAIDVDEDAMGLLLFVTVGTRYSSAPVTAPRETFASLSFVGTVVETFSRFLNFSIELGPLPFSSTCFTIKSEK